MAAGRHRCINVRAGGLCQATAIEGERRKRAAMSESTSASTLVAATGSCSIAATRVVADVLSDMAALFRLSPSMAVAWQSPPALTLIHRCRPAAIGPHGYHAGSRTLCHCGPTPAGSGRRPGPRCCRSGQLARGEAMDFEADQGGLPDDVLELFALAVADVSPTGLVPALTAETEAADLGLDSVQVLELVCCLEERLGARIASAELVGAATVQEILDVLPTVRRKAVTA